VRPDYAHDGEDAENFLGGRDAEEVEMSLLPEDDRRRAQPGFADGNGHLEARHKAPLSLEDKRAMVLLCVLYLIQGVPIGLALGMYLRRHLSRD